MKQGRVIILSGPSGVGKGTVLKEVMRRDPTLQFSISATTRAPRPGEIDGVHYFFVERARFAEMVEREELLEHAFYAGNYYGTPLKAVDDAIARGINVVLEIEVQGAIQAMKRCPEAISIFIAPPSLAELKRRLIGRGDTSPEVADLRLHIALQECALAEQYQYIVVNDSIEHAVEEVQAILAAEACRAKYRKINLKEEA